METATLHIYCPDELFWKPTEKQFQELLSFFSCKKFYTVSVLEYVEEDPLDYDDISFNKNVSSEDFGMYFSKSDSFWIMYRLNVDLWQKRIDDYMKTIDENIKGNWVPWSFSLSVGRHAIPDIYCENVKCMCEFCVGINGDGMPKDIPKCCDLITNSPPIIEIRQKLESLNSKRWETHISCSF